MKEIIKNPFDRHRAWSSLFVYLFLQDWRATVDPAALAVPGLIGGAHLFYFPLFGFSINTLSMFGAGSSARRIGGGTMPFVVVEGVQRHIEEGPCAQGRRLEKQNGRTLGSSQSAIALVLSAVFVPTAFYSRHQLGGSTSNSP